MKLKKVDRHKDDWQKCCRFCHYYERGFCVNEQVLRNAHSELEVWGISEDGYVAEVLEEVLSERPTLDEIYLPLENKLDQWKLSDKKKKEFREHFEECWESFINTYLKDKLDENVTALFSNRLHTSYSLTAVSIADPDSYCCGEWK